MQNSRRLVSKKSAALILFGLFLSLLAGLFFSVAPTLSAYNALVSMSEVGHLDFYAVPGSTATIIHLEQAGSPELGPTRLSQTEWSRIVYLQSDIRAIARTLKRVLGVNQLYVEGVSSEVLTNVAFQVEEARGYKLKRRAPEFDKSATIVEDAFLWLAVEDGFNLRAGSGVGKDLRRADDVVHAVAESYRQGETNRYAPVIACKTHNLRESIKMWNRTNTTQFSLLVVTSRSFR